MSYLISLALGLLFIATPAFAAGNQYFHAENYIFPTDSKFQGKVTATSTADGFHPCPSMTDAQMLAIASPQAGDCVHNTTLESWLVYNATDLIWEEVGGGAGGISNWLAGEDYEIGDVVIESNKIYQANTAHTSAVFAAEIANWTQIANDVSDSTGVLPMANGGTDKALTPTLGGVVYTDGGSMEVLGAGAAGQVLQSNGAAAPSWVNKYISIKSEVGSSTNVEEIQVPGNTLTQTDTSKQLIETGNKNILENPSFEHTNFATGWTISGDTGVSESTNIFDGKKALKIELVAEVMEVYQDSTLYASQFADGVQGAVIARIKTTVSGLKVCFRPAGVTSTSSNHCEDVNYSGKWVTYEIPAVLGGTSNGVSIHSNSVAVTGDVYIDDVFVGAKEVSTTKVAYLSLAGESYFPAHASCTGQTRASTVTIGPLATDVDCLAPVIERSTLGEWQTTDSDGIKQIINNLPAGKYKATFRYTMQNSTGAQTAVTIYDGTSYCPAQYGRGASSDAGVVESSCVFEYSSAGTRTFEPYMASGATITVRNALTSPAANVKFRLEYFGDADAYIQPCRTDIECANEFSAKVSSTGVVSDENVDWINGNAVVTSTSLFTMTFNSGIFATAPTCVVSSLRPLATGDHHAEIYSHSSTSVAVYTGTDVAVAFPFQIVCQRASTDYQARREIVGSFKTLGDIAVLKDVKASGTAGGDSSSSGYKDRNLNTLTDPNGIITNSSSFTGTGGTNTDFTLQPGKYYVRASAPARHASRHKIFLYNVTDATNAIVGSSHFMDAYTDTQQALLEGVVDVTGSAKTFKIRHWTANISSPYGLGYPVSIASIEEVYTVVEIRKLR